VPPWTTAVHGSNATITVADDGAFETVTVTIPKNGSLALLQQWLTCSQPFPCWQPAFFQHLQFGNARNPTKKPTR
jgi:hypothetical protein